MHAVPAEERRSASADDKIRPFFTSLNRKATYPVSLSGHRSHLQSGEEGTRSYIKSRMAEEEEWLPSPSCSSNRSERRRFCAQPHGFSSDFIGHGVCQSMCHCSFIQEHGLSGGAPHKYQYIALRPAAANLKRLPDERDCCWQNRRPATPTPLVQCQPQNGKRGQHLLKQLNN